MERLSANKAFTNKLWNAGKFILQNLPDKSDASSWEILLANKVHLHPHPNNNISSSMSK
jgi:valyl-tRNA synthetase